MQKKSMKNKKIKIKKKKKNFAYILAELEAVEKGPNAFTPEVRLKLSSHIPWHSLAHPLKGTKMNKH